MCVFFRHVCCVISIKYDVVVDDDDDDDDDDDGCSEIRTVSARFSIPVLRPFTVEFATSSSLRFSSCATNMSLGSVRRR